MTESKRIRKQPSPTNPSHCWLTMVRKSENQTASASFYDIQKLLPLVQLVDSREMEMGIRSQTLMEFDRRRSPCQSSSALSSVDTIFLFFSKDMATQNFLSHQFNSTLSVHATTLFLQFLTSLSNRRKSFSLMQTSRSEEGIQAPVDNWQQLGIQYKLYHLDDKVWSAQVLI